MSLDSKNFHENYYLAGGGYGFGILSQFVVGFGYWSWRLVLVAGHGC